ncbi:MAG: FkbM family methyltransferase [Burkholderiaceae bacterium]
MKNKRKVVLEAIFGKRLYQAYRYIKDKKDIYEPPKETALGFLFSGNEAMGKGEFEPEETAIVKKLIPRADVLINVGANVGYYCCIALSAGKPVIAFEPIYQNLQYLLRNIKANRWESGFEVFPIALSNKAGSIEIYGDGTGASLIKGWADTPVENVTLVPCTTMNNALGPRLHGKQCFFLVDIEGAEKFMLEGASDLINMTPKPIWMMEVSISEHQPKGVSINPNLLATFQIFWDAGYEAWTADKTCRLVGADEVKNIIQSGKDTILTHNFLFIENGRKKDFVV